MYINPLVERFLKETALPPTKFGRLAARDPRLVLDMRNGREIGGRMEARLRAFMIDYRARQSDVRRMAA